MANTIIEATSVPLSTLASIIPLNSLQADTLNVTPIDTGDSTALALAIAERLAKAGGTMTGPIVLAGAPSQDLHPATKKYVDDAALVTGALPKAGGTMTGALTLHANPIDNLEAATKVYVDNSLLAETTARAAAVSNLTGNVSYLTGTLSGVSTVANIASTLARAALPASGGTMTGQLAAPITSSWASATHGTVERTLADHLSGILNVKDFGAKGDGITDDTVAIQVAVAAAISVGKALRAPAGVYMMSNSIVGSGNFTLLGDGYAQTVFSWPSSSTAESSGFAITIGSVGILSQACAFYRLSCITAASSQGTAITVIGTTNIAADRISPRVVIEDVLIRGANHPFQDGWDVGIDLVNCQKTQVNRFFFWGRVNASGEPNYDTRYAISYGNSIGASPHPTEFSILNSYIGLCDTAVYATDFEGMLFRGNQLVGVNVGVHVTSPGPNYPHALISENHINAATACILAEFMFEVMISDNLLYSQNGNSAGAMVNLANGAGYFTIQGNIFENEKASTEANCIVVTAGVNGLVDGNIFRRSDSIDGTAHGVGVWLTPGSSGCRVGRHNTFYETTTHALDQGANNVVAHSDWTATQATTTNMDGLSEKCGTSVITLDASGNGTVPFNVAFPGGIITATACNGDPNNLPTAQFICNMPSSNAGVLAVSVRPNPGAVSCRFNWRATGY